jgi:hypothetical protein
MADGSEQELNVLVVNSRKGVPEIDGYPAAHAGRDSQHPLLSSGGGHAGAQGGDRGGPVDDGHGLPVGDAGADSDELAGEVGAAEPGLGDEEFGGGLVAVEAPGVSTQGRGQCGR